MSGCTIIPDSAVQKILISQTRDETLKFMRDIRRCLTQYSLSKERQYQPGSSVIVRPNGQKTLWRPFTAPTNVGCKIIVTPAPASDGHQGPLHGVLVLTDDKGQQTGVINAEEVTAYRTSLASMIPFMVRERVRNIVVFGAGKQALWHVRLALVLRGEQIERVTIVNRSEEKGSALADRLKADNEQRWKTKVEIIGLYQAQADYDTRLEKLLSQADVVFCTVPSTEPLFPANYLLNRRSGSNKPFVSAIGSWQPNMIELDPQLIKHAVSDSGGQKAILVDDRIGCLDHAGEVVQCKLKDEQLVEIGAVLGTEPSDDSIPRPEVSEAFAQWLKTGLVVYKSVGVSVTDLTSGQRLLTLAKAKGLGTTIPDF